MSLDFVDPEGRPVQVAKAELLLVAWGASERIQLDTSGHALSLELTPEWLRARWDRFDDQIGVHLYLEAPPYAAIRSYRFLWPGARQSAGTATTATIAFPRNQAAIVPRGANAHRTVSFRRKATRRVRLVDAEGEAFAGMTIGAYMFWSRSNHCGVLDGAEPLGSHQADDEGWIEIPDGDFDYAFELHAPHDHVFVVRGQFEFRHLVTELTHADTEVVVYRFPVRPLHMRVLRGSEPVKGVVLHGYLASCPCGACSGPLATSDEEGRIVLTDFRPGKFSSAWLDEGGRQLWRTVPTSWPSGIVDVLFPASSDVAEARFGARTTDAVGDMP